MVAAGLAFLFVFAAFAVRCATWHPQWTAGVEHGELFTPGEEPGRGYRIPAMVMLPDGVLLAFAESRVNAMSNLTVRPARVDHAGARGSGLVDRRRGLAALARVR